MGQKLYLLNLLFQRHRKSEVLIRRSLFHLCLQAPLEF